MIRVCYLSKAFGNVDALQDVSFELGAGSSLVVQGPSGSGKTTLLRLIAGLEIPTEGEIFFNGQLVSKPGWALPPNQRQLALVFQQHTLWPHMTVAQNIAFAVHDADKRKRDQQVSLLLGQFGLSGLANRFPDQISGGEARRVELARALAVKPRLLLMDEPLIYLDPELKQDLLQLILDTVRIHQMTLVYVTHDPDEAVQISSDKLHLSSGRAWQADPS